MRYFGAVDASRLKSIPLFGALSDREREQVARWADEIDVDAGRPLAGQGQFGYEFFAIEDGVAEVVKDGEPLVELGPGDFFGEIALIEEARRTASVVAKTPMRLVVMHRREFQHMVEEMPRVAERVRDAIRQRLPRG